MWGDREEKLYLAQGVIVPRSYVFCIAIGCFTNTAHNARHTVKSISLFFCAVVERLLFDNIRKPQ
jgi:hypothetical protein